LIATIRNTIATFSYSFVLTPKDFPIDPRKQATVNRVLNMMVVSPFQQRLLLQTSNKQEKYDSKHNHYE
jgi:hypothetical protein